jgi:uncharacterized protein
MVRRILSLLLATVSIAVAEPASVDSSSALAAVYTASPAEVSIPNTRKIDFTSKINGHRYSISVGLPFAPAPPHGYGVLYVLEGYLFFASAAEAVRDWSAVDVVVVGIGYPDDRAYLENILTKRGPIPAPYLGLPAAWTAPNLERLYDLMPPASNETLAAEQLPGFPKMKSENVGGVDDFLRMIETEVKPRVAKLAPIDSSNQALFGHSGGGLAVLHALFTEPAAFRTFIIASPSIWWNRKSVLADEKHFAAAVSSGEASPRILVTMGGTESTWPKTAPASWGDPVVLSDLMRNKFRMVENGRELVADLRSIRGGPGYVVDDYVVFDKQTHSASAWSALARGILFAFSPGGY